VSNERKETIEDIVAWLRRPREGENAYLTLWRDEIADRIETAHNREVDELRRRLKVAEDAISSASDAFRFCIEHCELELSPKMIGQLCDDGQACERALSFIREEGGSK
jgi:hypothetical protein